MTCNLPERSAIPPVPSSPVASTRAVRGARTFAELTTMGVGGTFERLVEASTEEEIIDTIRQADEDGTALMVMGGGSNILASDTHFPGVVLKDMRSGIQLLQEGGCEGANLRVLGGTAWDEFVVHTIAHEWMGVEALSGIPGTVGAAPVQNIGAYGQEVGASIARVRVYDRQMARPRDLAYADLAFSYRDSVIKRSVAQWGPSPRYVVLSVDFQLRIASLSAPIQYAQLAHTLGVEPGVRVPSVDVREAVLELRRSKGMVIDDADRDTFSAGSFFTNPIITEDVAAKLPDDAPRHIVRDASRLTLGTAAPVVEGQIKTSAAWLIQHAGFPPGYGMPGPAALSSKHSLAVTNRGDATGEQVRALVREIQTGVSKAFGIDLVPEPIIM